MASCVQFNIFISFIIVFFVNKMFGVHLMNFIRGSEYNYSFYLLLLPKIRYNSIFVCVLVCMK